MKDYLIWTLPILVIVLLGMYGCDNTRQKIGITTKPLQSGKSFENSTKLNWSITWGKIRSKNDEDDD